MSQHHNHNQPSIPDDLAEEIQSLALISLDGSATDEDLARLDQIVCEDPGAAQYLALCMQTSRHLRDWAGNLSASNRKSSARRSPVLGFLSNVLPIDSPMTTAAMWMVGVFGVLLLGGITAVVLVLVNGITVHVDNAVPQVAQQNAIHPQTATAVRVIASETVARLARTVDCVWAAAAEGPEVAPEVGDEFRAGHLLSLQSGLAEIVFKNGTVAILQGPATLEIGTRTSAFLKQGKCTVTVETPQAKGFEIHTPGMKFTDLGTEFGVSVERGGKQEMHVFRGRVSAEAEPIDLKSQSPSSPLGEGRREGNANSADLVGRTSPIPNPPAPVVLTAGQAVTIAAPGKPIEKIAADDNKFVRNLADRTPIPLFGTGVGVKLGEADPHWELAAISTDKNIKPQPVMAFQPVPHFVRDEHGRAQWIADPKHENMPKGCRWTLRTHFDLTGFDPSTARIEGRLAVDDDLVEIRLNGQKASTPSLPRSKTPSESWLPVKIESGFAAGDNVIEVVIENRAKVMGLCVDWNGTARLQQKDK